MFQWWSGFAPRKPDILALPRCTSSESLTSGCNSVAALALTSCNEHVAEENVSRPHPLTSRVLCTLLTQCSKLERSEKQLNFLVYETCAHGPAFPCSRANLPHGFLIFSLLRALFLPRAPHLQAAFSREIGHLQTGHCGCQMGTQFLIKSCCATSSAFAAAASTSATTTRISTLSVCSTTRPRFDLGCLIRPGNSAKDHNKRAEHQF